MILFDRSRYQTGLSCLRRRWYEYEYPTPDGGETHGIRPAKGALPLVVGSAVHAGLATLLRGAGDGESKVEEAVEEALHGEDGAFWPAIQAAGLQLEEGEDAPRVALEAAAIIEALLRAYAFKRLPLLMKGDPAQEFEVLEVEKEDTCDLGSGVTLMARADALLKEVCSGDLYIQSFKTAATWDSRQEKANRYDTQGLSEVMAVQARLDADAAAATDPSGLLPSSRIMGIRMEFLLKGRRAQYPEGSGQWVTFSPLIRGYKTKDSVPGETRYAHSYDWLDPEDINPKTGRPVKHTLSYKVWEPFWVWEEPSLGTEGGRVKAWIEMLNSGEVQPEAGDALAEAFVAPVPYFRQDQHIERLARQMAARETRIADDAGKVRNWLFMLRLTKTGSTRLTLKMVEDDLDLFFPMNSAACAYPSLCPYAGICWEGADPEQGLREGEWVARKPHHQPELARLEVSGVKKEEGQ